MKTPQKMSHLLVDIDVTLSEHPALAQALDLAARSGGQVTVVTVLDAVPGNARAFVTPSLEAELVEHLEQELANIVAKATPRVPVDTTVLRGRHARAVIKHAIAGKVDLLLRSHGVRFPDVPQPFGPIDLALLRQCPCPVWIVSPSARVPIRTVLAAANALQVKPEQRQLSTRILETALAVAEAEGAKLTVLEAWSVFAEELIRPRVGDEEADAFLADHRRQAEEVLVEFVRPYGDQLKGTTVELVRGDPETVIPTYVLTHGIDLVVMGQVARTGLAGLLIGNTAERVLRRLQGSVLTVKPAGFESSLAKAFEGTSPASQKATKKSAGKRSGPARRETPSKKRTATK